MGLGHAVLAQDHEIWAAQLIQPVPALASASLSGKTTPPYSQNVSLFALISEIRRQQLVWDPSNSCRLCCVGSCNEAIIHDDKILERISIIHFFS